MARDLTAAVATEAQATDVRVEALAHFQFDSGSLRLWTGLGDLSWSGDTYTGAGDLGAISPVEEAAAVKTSDLTFSLSGLPASLVTTALSEHYQGRVAEMWVGFFDDAWALIDDPVQLFAGRVDVMSVVDNGDTASISVTATNRLKDLDRPNNPRFYTLADQQQDFPGDLGFQYVPEMQNAVIVWGKGIVDPSSGAPVATQAAGGPSAAATQAVLNQAAAQNRANADGGAPKTSPPPPVSPAFDPRREGGEVGGGGASGPERESAI